MAKELEKVTIRLEKGQRERLNSLYPSLGYTKVIRALVQRHLREIDEKAEAHVIDLEETKDA